MTPTLPPLTTLELQGLREHLRPHMDGRVTGVVGQTVRGHCPGASIGDVLKLQLGRSRNTIEAEVVGLSEGALVMIPLADPRGLTTGSRITHHGQNASVACSISMLGRVLDAQGRPLDHKKGVLEGPFTAMPLYRSAPGPLERKIISEPLVTGIRVIDGLLTLGRGQRIGIMAGAGVGKSTLMGWLTQNADADVIVMALIGERGREVSEFLHKTLPEAARKRCVMVAVTSDRSPLERTRGAYVATAVSEYFAAHGQNVLLMMDSLTRFAMAQRELGLSMGEAPATRGYTPSVFSQLPRLLERPGLYQSGSITGIYTVLVEGDDLNDPVGDSARSILDGHIVLSRDLAARGHFPAVDALASVSRVMDAVTDPGHLRAARVFRQMLALQQSGEELQQLGAYNPGSDPRLDAAMQRKRATEEFLQQGPRENTPVEQCVDVMHKLVGGIG